MLTGANICKPPSGGLRKAGVITDDVLTSLDCTLASSNCSASNAGYGDDRNCGIRVYAPAGQHVSATFASINMEAGHKTGCGTCPAGGCDFIAIYDGPALGMNE